ncbi:MAG: arsenate reductase ArsC [Candidatus Helarchaeota archaeon]
MLKNILFICRENRARSQIAEGIANLYKNDNMKIFSAGLEPAEFIHPLAIEVMAEIGIDISKQYTKSIDEIDFNEIDIDIVITLCDTTCPVLPPDIKQIHWELLDPVEVQGTKEEKLKAFRNIRDTILEKIKQLFKQENIKQI